MAQVVGPRVNHDYTEVSDNVSWYPPTETKEYKKSCPHCGRCPTCGRGGYNPPYEIAWSSQEDTSKVTYFAN